MVEPYPEWPERLLGPMVAALVFVWIGSRIAPARKIETAVVLFGMLLLLLGAAFALGATGAHIGNSQMFVRLGGLAPAAAVVGAFIGLYIVRRERAGSDEATSPANPTPA